MALLTDVETDASTFVTAASFPRRDASDGRDERDLEEVPYLPGTSRRASYHVYANVTGCGERRRDGPRERERGDDGADVPGARGGVVQHRRRELRLSERGRHRERRLDGGAKAYTITATDMASNPVTQGGFSVNVDNTRPSGSAMATTNGGSIVGRPELNDTITLTFTETIDPQSVLANWTGAATSVVVRIANVAGGDTLTIRNAANSAQLPLGSVNLGRTGYVTAQRDWSDRHALVDGSERRIDHDHARDRVGCDDDAGRDDVDGMDATVRRDRPGGEHVHDNRHQRGGTGRRRVLNVLGGRGDSEDRSLH